MNPITREWVEFAEVDYATALTTRRSRKIHARHVVCFHLQQCLEKYLKARLVEAGVHFPKTHDLGELLDVVMPLEPLWAVYRRELTVITVHAVRSRYPGGHITSVQAKEVLDATTRIRRAVRQSLGLR